MAGITIGRVGLVDSLELGKPEFWNESGSTVEVGGRLIMSSVADALWMRRQLLGLLDRVGAGGGGDNAIPVTWSGETTIDGYYFVRDVEVSVAPGALRHGILPWRVTLERLPWWRNPLLEDLVVSTVITNAHSLNPTFGIATAVAASQNFAGVSGGATWANTADVTTATGESVHWYLFSTGSGTSPGTLLYQLPVASFYHGACRIEVGTSKRVLVGGNTADDSATGWRLGNGLIRVSPLTNGLRVGIWTGAAWETKDFNIYLDESNGYVVNQWDSFSVIANSPEQVTVRCTVRDNSTSFYSDLLDVTVKKGRRLVEVALTTLQGTRAYGFRMASSEAATAITGGIRATSNDANGNRYMIVCPSAVTTTLASGRIRLTSAATSALFGLALELNGSSQTEALEQITGSGGLRDTFFRTCHTMRRVVAP